MSTPAQGEVEIELTGQMSGVAEAGQFTATPSLGEYRDELFDLDDDKRFFCRDITTLSEMFNSSGWVFDPSLDFNDDGLNNVVDLDFLQNLLDAGVGAGLAGDGDRDCEVTCADLTMLSARLGAQFGDPNYLISLDMNLDKVIDAEDEAMLVDIVGDSCRVGDFNGDGCVDGTDQGILLGAWGPCEARPEDLNGDGQVDGSDLGILFGNWGCNG